MEGVCDLDPARHADDLRETWQVRMLVHTQYQPMGAFVLSMLAHHYDAEMLQVLLRIVVPRFNSIHTPFICSAGKVAKTGKVVADVVFRDEHIRKDTAIFNSLNDMRGKLRRLADKMRLDDDDRREFFTLARKWVVADRRLDPTMNPADPDAKRLTIN